MKSVPTILLVEDDPLVLRALSRLLKGRGMDVVSATSVRSALRIERLCQGAIVDINLPDGSGLGLVEQFLARGDDLKVVFFSATADHEEQRQAIAMGEFIRKDRGPEAAVDFIAKRLGFDVPESAPRHELPHSTVVPPQSTERRRRGGQAKVATGEVARRKVSS